MWLDLVVTGSVGCSAPLWRQAAPGAVAPDIKVSNRATILNRNETQVRPRLRRAITPLAGASGPVSLQNIFTAAICAAEHINRTATPPLAAVPLIHRQVPARRALPAALPFPSLPTHLCLAAGGIHIHKAKEKGL